MYIQHKNQPFTFYGSYQNSTIHYYDSADKSINLNGNLIVWPSFLNTPYNYITNPDGNGCLYPNYINKAITEGETVVIKAIAITSGTNLEPFKVYFLRIATLKKGYLYHSLSDAMTDTNRIDLGVFQTVEIGFITKTYRQKVVRFYADAVQCCPEPPIFNRDANFLPKICIINYKGNEVTCILGYDNSQFPGFYVYGGYYFEPNNGYPYIVFIRVVINKTFYPQNLTWVSCDVGGVPFKSDYFASSEFPLSGQCAQYPNSNETLSYEFKYKEYLPDSIHLYMPDAKFYASKGPTIELGTIDTSLAYNAEFAGYVSNSLNYYSIPGRITIHCGYYYPTVQSGYKFLMDTITNQVNNLGELYVDSGNLVSGQFLSVTYSESQSILHPEPYKNLDPPDPFFKNDYFSIRSNNVNSYYSSIR